MLRHGDVVALGHAVVAPRPNLEGQRFRLPRRRDPKMIIPAKFMLFPPFFGDIRRLRTACALVKRSVAQTRPAMSGKQHHQRQNHRAPPVFFIVRALVRHLLLRRKQHRQRQQHEARRDKPNRRRRLHGHADFALEEQQRGDKQRQNHPRSDNQRLLALRQRCRNGEREPIDRVENQRGGAELTFPGKVLTSLS